MEDSIEQLSDDVNIVDGGVHLADDSPSERVVGCEYDPHSCVL